MSDGGGVGSVSDGGRVGSMSDGSSIGPVQNSVNSIKTMDNSCLTVKRCLESGDSTLHLSNGVGISVSASFGTDGSNSKAGNNDGRRTWSASQARR